jgi:peroxiredoxin
MPLIEPGKKAPAFALKDQTGKTHRLSEYAGRPVILYFYPKDDTPGRTYMGIARTTYPIGPDGKVRKRWDKVKVDGHADEVLAAFSKP